MAYPNLLIVGATKAGTTSVFRYLADHADVCASSQKEINFFFRYHNDVASKTLAKYQSYFRHCTDQHKVRLEASPVYLSGGNWIAKQIDHLMPQAKLVFILRDPVARYLSHFKFCLAKTDNVPAGATIEDAIRQGLSKDIELGERDKDTNWEQRATQLVRAGCYARSLSGYLEDIAAERILVTFFEDLAVEPQAFMRRICAFAGIDDAIYDDYAFSVENKTRLVRHKGLHRLTIGANNFLQPVLNRAPAVRKAVRSVYYTMNKETDQRAGDLKEANLSALRAFYSRENAELARLLSRVYPDLALPDWLTAA